jgi:hypothetical protein
VAAVIERAPDSYYREVNVLGTERLLEAAARQGVRRFVHTSTVGVHGHVEHPPADETAPFAPGDIYQATKAEAEALALDFHRRRGVPVAVVRPGAIYGPGETRFLKLFRAIARGRYAIVGTGRTFYHPVYIDDLVSGFLLALDRPEAVGQSFLLCGPSYASQADLAALIAKHTGGRVLPFRIPARPIQWAGDLVEAICVLSASSRPAPSSGGLLDQEPGVHDREGAPPARVLAEGGPRRGHRPHGGGVPGGRVAVKPRLALALVTLALVASTLTLDLPRASTREFWGDGATYYAMAWSLARDRDLRFDAGDLSRVRAEYPNGPQGLFLKRTSGGLTVDAAAGFPWIRRVRPDEGRLYFAKAFAHPLVVAPLVWLLGTRGLTLANGLLLAAALWLACFILQRRGMGPWAALATAAALLLLTVTPVYLVWPTPEILGLALITAGLASWAAGRPLLAAFFFGGRIPEAAQRPHGRALARALPREGEVAGRRRLGESVRRGVVPALTAASLG